MPPHAIHQSHYYLGASAWLLATTDRDNQSLLHLHPAGTHPGNRSLLYLPLGRLATISCLYPSWPILRTLPETSGGLATALLHRQSRSLHAVRLLHADSATSILLSTRDSRRAIMESKEGMISWAISNTTSWIMHMRQNAFSHSYRSRRRSKKSGQWWKTYLIWWRHRIVIFLPSVAILLIMLCFLNWLTFFNILQGYSHQLYWLSCLHSIAASWGAKHTALTVLYSRQMSRLASKA